MYKYMVLPGTLTLEKLVALMSDNPRRIFGLGGGLNVGDEADFTVLDLGAQYEVDPAAFLSKGRATPFAGWPVQGRAVLTVVGTLRQREFGRMICRVSYGRIGSTERNKSIKGAMENQ